MVVQPWASFSIQEEVPLKGGHDLGGIEVVLPTLFLGASYCIFMVTIPYYSLENCFTMI